MSRSILYLGMDVHKESVTIAVLPGDAAAPTRVDRLPNDLAKLKRFIDRLADNAEIRACYEASGAGYVLQRALRDWGHACEGIAPPSSPASPASSASMTCGAARALGPCRRADAGPHSLRDRGARARHRTLPRDVPAKR